MENTPRGMKKTKHIHYKEIFVAYIPVNNPRRCFSELFDDEMKCDAWMLMNKDKIAKVVELRVRETFTETFVPEEE